MTKYELNMSKNVEYITICVQDPGSRKTSSLGGALAGKRKLVYSLVANPTSGKPFTLIDVGFCHVGK